jgi:hypothetical protein
VTLFGESSARFSPCRQYRYELRRIWDDGPIANFIMLNPSTADEVNNDPTVERQGRRVRGWGLGYGGLIVTNIFAWRSTDPSVLKTLVDPVGPEYDDAIVEAAHQSQIVICAWGNHGKILGRGEAVRKRLYMSTTLHYLRMSEEGHPWHPLYLPYGLTPTVWNGTGA